MENEKNGNKELIAALENLKNTAAWEQTNTQIAGVTVTHPPATKNGKTTLMVHINPTGKRKGIYIKTPEELIALRQALNQEKLETLLQAVATVNQDSSSSSSTPDLVI